MVKQFKNYSTQCSYSVMAIVRIAYNRMCTSAEAYRQNTVPQWQQDCPDFGLHLVYTSMQFWTLVVPQLLQCCHIFERLTGYFYTVNETPYSDKVTRQSIENT